MVFTSRDALGVRLIKTANLSENQGLEQVSSGIATGYDLHTVVASQRIDVD